MAKVAAFYSGKNVLITGSTGFLGTALVEKLLRSFPQVNKIYNMVRAPKCGSVEERTSIYFDNKVFRRYLQIGRHSPSKIKWIQCDFGMPGLNLAKDEVTSIIENVHVIIHCATILHFKAPLRQAAAVNITGTQELLEIAKQCKNLESFVYVSSAYTNALKHGDIIDETLGPYKADYTDIYEKLKNRDDATVKAMYKDWIDGWGNTYVLTKNATETLVHDYRNNLPIGIYRPGSVLHAYAEPYPYWEQSDGSMMNVLKNLDKGLHFPFLDYAPFICIPVDLCANGLIAAAYDVSKNSSIKFYNCTNSNNIITYRKAFNYTLDGIRLEGVNIPDAQKAKQKYSKKNEEFEKLAYSIKHLLDLNVSWLNKNFEALWEKLDNADKELLFCDLNSIYWKKYFTNMFKHSDRYELSK